MTNPNEDMLEDAFAQARAVNATPGDDVMARILADAQRVQGGFTVTPAPQRAGLWERMMDVVGGWPAVSGLAAATVAGIWVGVAPPTALDDLTSSVIGDAVSVSLFSSDFGFDTGVLIDG